MKPAHLRVLVPSALVSAAAGAALVFGAGPARAASCDAGDARSDAAVRIDRPRPLAVVSGTVAVTGDVQSLPVDPVGQIELYVDGTLTATRMEAGSDISFRFDWDSSTASGRTALRVVACGPRTYGAASVLVEVERAPASTTSSTLPVSTTPTVPGAASSTTSTTVAGAAGTTTTIIKATTTTTTTTPKSVVAPTPKPGEDSGYLRAVQPPQRMRRAVTDDERTPTWPALAAVGGGLVGMTIALAPGRRWLALVGVARPSRGDAVIDPEPGQVPSDPPS